MGDRANVVVLQPKGDKVKEVTDALFNKDRERVYLYTHWNGSELPQTLQSALSRRLRWDDHAYLTRIIFCEMVKGDEEGETGFGISTTPPDNSHDFLVVDPNEQTVSLVRERDGKRIKSWTFEEYIALAPKVFKSF